MFVTRRFLAQRLPKTKVRDVISIPINHPPEIDDSLATAALDSHEASGPKPTQADAALQRIEKPRRLIGRRGCVFFHCVRSVLCFLAEEVARRH